jgi:hypothetical protein
MVLDPNFESKLDISVRAQINNGSEVGPFLHKFLLATDSSSFWVCGYWGVYKYNHDYSLPEEVTSSIQLSVNQKDVPTVKSVHNEVHFQIPGGLRWSGRILDLHGNVAWTGSVADGQKVSLPNGLWIVDLRNGTDRKTLRIVLMD